MSQAKAIITIEAIAKTAHEVNKAYCESIGDFSQPTWEDAPQWQKDSAINGVKFHITVDATPEDSHINWMKQKIDEGWIYGPVKDPVKKQHPCMMSYSDLPQEQRTKDYLFRTIVHSLKEFL